MAENIDIALAREQDLTQIAALVARCCDSVVGFVNFTTRKTMIHPSESGLIDELIVSREYRGKGVGQRLISAVIDRCRQLGCCELEVSTLMSNERARAFYKKCGFAEEAVLLEIDLLEHSIDSGTRL